jgi:hypothetical protein
MKSTNMLERLNQELKRRTHVVHLSRCRELSAAGPRACRRGARELILARDDDPEP